MGVVRRLDHLAQDGNRLRALVNAEMNLWLP
jgi:hypothetical protein